ncbi:tetratricopeptide repeat protein [uncultured Tenacibaculum sp.]|uniref:tetratricopeptide repeat protein n=1 Tax=uncultured Tenacibaculum sp. TaxID=174713 RepID=UPI002636A822|nr:tetratricopeptide repeat protein [uncultured Tenacibaculum sp.]
MYIFILFILLFGAVLMPLSTLIHELGHGIPALLFTKEKVTIYLGSLGNPKKSLLVKIGRLEFFFNKELFNWKTGLCRFEKGNMSINKHIIIVLMGPIASLILSLILSYFIFFYELSDNLKAFLFLFNVSTYYDFLVDILPSNRPIKLDDDSSTYNDGKQILELIKYKYTPEEYNIAIRHYNNKEYYLSTIALEKVLKKGYKKQLVYRLLISAYLQEKDYVNAMKINDLYIVKFKKELDSNDYTNSGLLKSHLSKYNEAIKDYNKAIEMDPNNDLAFNNRGYTYNILEDYEKGLKDFEKAILLNSNFAYALNNRGFSKIKLGDKKEGFEDLKKSMKIDGTNSYCYLNFGLYYFENNEYEKALDYLKKAKELDDTTHLLNTYLEKVKKKLVIENR